jgi:hypothetical protein
MKIENQLEVYYKRSTEKIQIPHMITNYTVKALERRKHKQMITIDKFKWKNKLC